MPEDLKALIYAVHDTYGYHPDEDDRCQEILHLLNKRGWFLVRDSDLNDNYNQGWNDATQQSAEDYR